MHAATLPMTTMPAATSPDDARTLDRMLTIDEVCQHFQISSGTVYRMIAACEFPAPMRIGRRLVRWPAMELNRYIAAGCMM